MQPYRTSHFSIRSSVSSFFHRLLSLSLLLSGAVLLSSCSEQPYLKAFHISFFSIGAVMAGMAIFGYYFSRRRLRRDKSEERERKKATGTGTPTR